jgi:ribosomal protein S18 acetylase RimI-like enzyme
MTTAVASRGVSVRTMTEADIDYVVRLQQAFLEGSVVTELGEAFLKRFHRASLSHASVRALVATDAAGLVVGFVQASLDVHAFNRDVTRQVLVRLALSLLNPDRWRLVPQFVRHALTAREPQPAIPSELLLLVVDASVRRHQIGRRLVEALERIFASEHVVLYRVAVRSHLAVARAFYVATGFTPEQELTVLGGSMTYLTKVVRP